MSASHFTFRGDVGVTYLMKGLDLEAGPESKEGETYLDLAEIISQYCRGQNGRYFRNVTSGLYRMTKDSKC